MKNTAFFVLLLLAALIAGCGWNPFGPDEEKNWKELEEFDFPVYVGHFADYDHTDESGNFLGHVIYGKGGDKNDWKVLPYDSSDKSLARLRGLIKHPEEGSGPKDPYYICVEARRGYGHGELTASIFLDSSPTGFFTPHTFTHAGAYDSSLESLYSVGLEYYDFDSFPLVTHNTATSTYTYTFFSMGDYPPELSSFTATLTDQYYVKLAWCTQSETQMLGFRLYRSSSCEASTATLISPDLIPATNTSQMHTYTVVDSSVVTGSTYFYWLEHVACEDSFIAGPVSITVPYPPPNMNHVRKAYPNPCYDSFNLELAVKEGVQATVILLDADYKVHGSWIVNEYWNVLTPDVNDLDPGLHRVFIWFSDGEYAYGDILIQNRR